MDNMDNNDFIKLLQSCNINFLIGAGTSMPAIHVLGNLEDEIKNSNENEKEEKLYKLIKPIASVNYEASEASEEYIKQTIEAYELFIDSITNILTKRKSNNVLPVANIFTTNYDLFLEYACETCSNYINYNDGFQNKNSMFSDVRFDISEFHKIVSYKSDAYSKSTNIPNINILKMHGSINWKVDTEKNMFDKNNKDKFITYNNEYQNDFDKIENIFINKAKVSHISLAADSKNDTDYFREYINKLGIVLPIEDKFRATVQNRVYYGILRHFSTELEKENTMLIAIGFSFRDDHINDILFNALKVNPTLQLIISVYENKENKELERFKKIFRGYNNVSYISEYLTLQKFSENKLSLNKDVQHEQ